MPLPTTERKMFDRLLEKVLKSLPPAVSELLEQVPVIVDDEPTEQILREISAGASTSPSELCGLHWGIPLGSRSMLDGEPVLDRIAIFRGPILRLSGGVRSELRKQIHITLLHEIAHHFGMDEEELEMMGYG
ncbi:MAG: hypothetical protein A2X94_15255 [Bdellovibrionales bacterium GWB1_55_8]|nr:MAG: hypothetical protein A2X94_15255 [Bdellovibrionales bacterium GWB1_55_8]